MKRLLLSILPVLLPAIAHGGLLVHEPFDYVAGVGIADRVAGSGWASSWTKDGSDGSVVSPGLGYTDASGNVLQVSGLAAATQAASTSRNFRMISGGPINDVWVSFIYHIPSGGTKFVGLSFLRGSQFLFAIQSPSTDASANIWLGNYVVSGASSTGIGVFGRSHFIVLRVQKGAGEGGQDVVNAFVDPLLDSVPSSSAMISAPNLDFDAIRIAGQDGSPLLIDEIRIGTNYTDVSPHASAQLVDTDGDGISDAREILLGLNPLVSDATLIASIRQHPDFFNLYDRTGILSLRKGGAVIPSQGKSTVDFRFGLEYSRDLVQWSMRQEFSRSVQLPSNKNFLRLTVGGQ